MTKLKRCPLVLICFAYLCIGTIQAQTSKIYSILEREPVFGPTTSGFALGGVGFITLLDGSSVFQSQFYGKNAIVHANKSSNTPWAKVITFENRQVYPTILPTPDGGFLVKMGIAKVENDEKINKFALSKFSAQNILEWTKTIQFNENATTDVGTDKFAVDANGNTLLTGTVKEANTTESKYFYIFLNRNGELVRSFYFNELVKNVSMCSRVEGGFAVVASIALSSQKLWFMLFDAQGQLISSKSYLSEQRSLGWDTGFKNLIQKADGGFVGVFNWGVFQFDNTGNFLKSLIIDTNAFLNFGYILNADIYADKNGNVYLPGALIASNLDPAFIVFNDVITIYSLEGVGNTQAFAVSGKNDGGLTLSIGSFRFSTLTNQPPLNVIQYAINSKFDKTDCGISISKQTLPSTTFNLVRTNTAELVANNLNTIITPRTSNSLQLTNFNISHNALCTSVSVKEAPLENSISISPNPSSEVFRIESNHQNVDLQRLTVYNNLGQIVVDKVKPHWSDPLSIAQSGAYLVKLQTNEGTIQKKIIKVD
jgi:hypothetical protein